MHSKQWTEHDHLNRDNPTAINGITLVLLTSKFIVVLTRARHLTVSADRRIQLIFPEGNP
jgi:hypothetical protein